MQLALYLNALSVEGTKGLLLCFLVANFIMVNGDEEKVEQQFLPIVIEVPLNCSVLLRWRTSTWSLKMRRMRRLTSKREA